MCFLCWKYSREVGFSDGSAFELHGLWLRDACRDALVVSQQAGDLAA